ncbi:MAG: hypothetical protein A2W58_02235 [Candidatus Zambryskibacteria bacterium RIFCSPHIGHO2_02_38_10.5]|uniref:Uncharacterized protein n=1 Tax=Candidatus Zambryskibacteria bacterium RIFCSPHIGHO2_02_38_10.5 TaxID=1802742 RepID=A0A1G2TAK0_9BACT|nr:MAG: hypothetical protein A2W58_02235 [Candidatus Zambryskibacteria bacterium RIFCSPHIGHO2_02_38_10.5]
MSGLIEFDSVVQKNRLNDIYSFSTYTRKRIGFAQFKIDQIFDRFKLNQASIMRLRVKKSHKNILKRSSGNDFLTTGTL